MLDGITLDQVRVFVAIAETGSVRAAARRLGRAQSALSFALANLEAQLGIALFDRSARAVRPTEAGQALLQDAQVLLTKAQAFRARGRALGQGVEAAVGLAVEVMVSPNRLAQVLSAFRGAYPLVGLRVWSEPLGGPLDALRRGDAMLAVVATELLRDADMEFEPCGRIEFRAVAASASPLAAFACQRPLTGEELADHVQIVVPDPGISTAGTDFGVQSPHRLVIQDVTLKAALIAEGLGWGHLPEHLAAPLSASGRLAALNLAETGPAGRSWAPAFLARRRDTALGPAATHLRRLLKDMHGD